MRYIVVALKAEANFIIDTLNLELIEKDPFLIYQNSSYSLVLSGIGSLNAAVATTYLLTKYPPKELDSIVNFGSCGAVSTKVGTTAFIGKIVDRCNDSVYHLDSTKKGRLSITTISQITTDKAQIKTDLVDMESSGFYLSAKRFFKIKDIEIIKTVTDNMAFDESIHDKIVEVIESVSSKAMEMICQK